MNRPSTSAISSKALSLEGLRGLACLVVVLDHLQLAFFNDYLVAVSGWFRTFMPNFLADKLAFASSLILSGPLAVTVFWVLSGYVLTAGLHQKYDQERLISSVLKRYFRLAIPVAASVFIAWLLIQAGMNLRDSYISQSQGALTGWLKSFNNQSSLGSAANEAFWGPFFNLRAPCEYNPVLWTMGPELAGSFLCFALLAVFRQSSTRFIAYGALVLFSLVEGSMDSVGTAYGGFAWVVCFVAGTLIADLRSSDVSWGWPNGQRWFGAIGLNLVVILCLLQLRWGYLRPIAACLLVVLALENPPLRRFLSTPFVTWLGAASFAIYLLHFSVIMSLGIFVWFLAHNAGLGQVPAGFAASLASAITIFIVAIPFTALDRRAVLVSAAIGRWLSNRSQRRNSKASDSSLVSVPTGSP